jgi:hypothetical protein
VTATALEILLARLYGDSCEVERFLIDRRAYAIAAGLSIDQLPSILEIDAAILRFAARSYERKRRPSSRTGHASI